MTIMNETPQPAQQETSTNQETIASEFSFLARIFLEKLQVPKQDIEKNAKAFFAETISKMDLVTRDELTRQQQLLHHAQEQLADMKKKVAELEILIRSTDHHS